MCWHEPRTSNHHAKSSVLRQSTFQCYVLCTIFQRTQHRTCKVSQNGASLGTACKPSPRCHQSVHTCAPCCTPSKVKHPAGQRQCPTACRCCWCCMYSTQRTLLLKAALPRKPLPLTDCHSLRTACCKSCCCGGVSHCGCTNLSLATRTEYAAAAALCAAVEVAGQQQLLLVCHEL